MKTIKIILLLFLSALAAHGQGAPGQSNYPISQQVGVGAPSGNCPGTNVYYLNSSNGNIYTCPAAGGAWALGGGGAGGGTSLGTAVALKLPVAVTSVNGFGDSLTAGVQIQTGQLSQIWFNLVALAWNMPIGTNFSVAGTRINAVGQISSAYTQTPTTTVGSAMLLGTNEMTDAGTANARTQIGLGQMAMFAWLALPAANRVLASAMTQVGTWNSSLQLGLTSEFSGTNNATLTTATTVTGSVCYVAGLYTTGQGVNLDVLIDGVSQTAGAGVQLTYALTAVGEYPYLLRFPGLTNTAHTIQVKALSATSAVADIHWVGCNGATPPGIFVADGSPILQTGVANATITALNAVTVANVALLAGDGLSVFYVDDYTPIFNLGSSCPAANPPVFNADCLHPNVLGNEIIAGRWLDILGSQPITGGQVIALEKAYFTQNFPPPASIGNLGTNGTAGCVTPGVQAGCVLSQYLATSGAGAGNVGWAGNPRAWGTCTFAAATTCTITYTQAFTVTPVLNFTPINPGAVTFTLTSTSNTAFTLTGSGASSIVVNWTAFGNPN